MLVYVLIASVIGMFRYMSNNDRSSARGMAGEGSGHSRRSPQHTAAHPAGARDYAAEKPRRNAPLASAAPRTAGAASHGDERTDGPHRSAYEKAAAHGAARTSNRTRSAGSGLRANNEGAAREGQNAAPTGSARRGCAPESARASARGSRGGSGGSGATATTAPARPKSRYIPALDGLRTLAVIAVVLYHLNFTWAQGGLLGVTVFFVLSGYLITRLLLNEIAKTGRIDLKGFWIRRIRRLFPAVVTVVVVTTVLCTIFNHVMLTKMRPDILPSLLFFNNWWQIFQNVSYFNAVGDPSPLTHFWSLAIEEQFYLIWPVLLFGLVAAGAKKPTVRRISLGLALVSAAAMTLLYNPSADPSRLYYGTDTRAFSLLLGAWMAFIPDRDLPPARMARRLRLNRLPGVSALLARGNGDGKRGPSAVVRFLSSPASVDLIGLAGLIGLGAMVVLTNGYTAFQYQGGTFLCSVLSLMVIAACVQEHGVIARVLAARPLVWAGKRSYSIYLWHYPLLLLMNPVANINDTPWWHYVIQVAIVVGVAEFCYEFIETPFRKGAVGRVLGELRSGQTTPAGWARRHIPVCAACTLVLAVAAAGIVFVPDTSALSGEGAEILQGESKNVAPEEQQAADDTDDDDDGFPDGAYDLLMIGDSVSLRAVDAFSGVFPHGHIDAAKGRQFTEGQATFESYIQQNLAGKVVVFALGTNGLVTDDQIDSLMADAGDKRFVVFINTRSPQPWVASTNQAIASAADRYKNVHVIDWYGYSANRNDLFDGDGTHLSTTGVNEYLQLIYDTVKKDLPVHPEDHADDPQPQAVQNAANALVKALAYQPHKLGEDK